MCQVVRWVAVVVFALPFLSAILLWMNPLKLYSAPYHGPVTAITCESSFTVYAWYTYAVSHILFVDSEERKWYKKHCDMILNEWRSSGIIFVYDPYLERLTGPIPTVKTWKEE